MQTRRGQMPYVENILSQEDVRWIMAKESLISAGEFPSAEAFITSNWISPVFIIYGSRLSSSATECYPSLNTDYDIGRFIQQRQKGILRAYNKVVAQMKNANIGADKPHLEEPVSETGFTYPSDKVISIQRGRKLNRRA